MTGEKMAVCFQGKSYRQKKNFLMNVLKLFFSLINTINTIYIGNSHNKKRHC